MKNTVLLLALLISLQSCSQKKDKNMNTEITSENIVEKINEQVKHYPKEPVYQVYVKNSLCLYEISVNDFPIGKLFEYSQQATPYFFNSEILKSGKQKITLRLYPAPPEYSRSGDVLSPNASCEIELVSVDNKDPNYNSVPVAKFTLPTKVRMAGQNKNVEIPEFEGEGKKYYEITYEFDATVPYENEGWSNGQDLTKLDQKLLEKKTLEFYNYYKKNYDKHELNVIARNEFALMSRDAVSQYQQKEEVRKIWNDRIEMIDIKKEWLPLKYKIQFYGNGKIITLLQGPDTDIRFKRESALAFKYNKNEVSNGRFLGLYLYLPKGKKLEDGLEVIR